MPTLPNAETADLTVSCGRSISDLLAHYQSIEPSTEQAVRFKVIMEWELTKLRDFLREWCKMNPDLLSLRTRARAG